MRRLVILNLLPLVFCAVPPLVAAVIALSMIGHFTVYTYITPLLRHDGVAGTGVSGVLFGYGVAGLIGLTVADVTAYVTGCIQ